MLPLIYPYLHILLIISALLITWYMLVILPQSNLQKTTVDLKANLHIGAFVATRNGTQGIVTAILSNVIIIRTADGELIEILPWSIASVNKPS